MAVATFRQVGFCLFGGFAPMVFEAAESWATWMPPLLLSLGGEGMGWWDTGIQYAPPKKN